MLNDPVNPEISLGENYLLIKGIKELNNPVVMPCIILPIIKIVKFGIKIRIKPIIPMIFVKIKDYL